MLCNYKKLFFPLILLFMLLTLGSGIMLEDIPFRDVAQRYAPMAEAFADGNWQFAFHPRIQPLSTVTGGVLAYIFQCDGFMGMKMASVIWQLGSLVLLFVLIKKVVPRPEWAAAATAALMAIFPLTFHTAYSGLRESGKTFALLLMALAIAEICRKPRQLTGCVLLGIGCGLAMLTRVEMIIVSVIVLLAGAIMAFRFECRYWKIALAPLIAGGFATVNLVLNYHVSGYAVPDVVFIKYLLKAGIKTVEILPALGITLAAVLLAVPAAWGLEKLTRKVKFIHCITTMMIVLVISTIYICCKTSCKELPEYLQDIFIGFYHFGGIFILLTIGYLAYCKKLTADMKILLMVFSVNLAISILSFQLGQGKLYISSRYIYPAMPLLLVFMVLGINEAYWLLRKIKFGPAVYVNILLALVIAGIFGGMFFHMYQPQLRERSRHKIRRQNILELTQLIRQDKINIKPSTRPAARTDVVYESCRSPKVFFSEKGSKHSVAAYLAGGGMTAAPGRADYIAGYKLPKKFSRKVIRIGSTVDRKGKVIYLWRVVR